MNKVIVLETEILTDIYLGIYTKTIYYSDGTVEVVLVPKGRLFTKDLTNPSQHDIIAKSTKKQENP